MSGSPERKNPASADEVISRLKAEYPGATTALDWNDPLQLLVAVMLSAQTTDVQVNRVTPGLFKKYRSARDYAEADPEELEAEIQSIGFYRNKARSIRTMARSLEEKHDGEVPRTMEDLVALSGVGRKTANVVLGNAFDINEGVVVDTHVRRLSQRLGFTEQQEPEKIERDLIELVPEEGRTLFSHLLIYHGRRVCKARKPDCPGCVLNDICPSSTVP